MNLNKPDYAGKSASELIEIFEATIAARRRKQMKVKDLIAALENARIDPDAEVFVWVDGVRYRIDDNLPVDPIDGFVDITTQVD